MEAFSRLNWGIGISDSDPNAPDFFVLEDLGNDTVEVQAILNNGVLGQPVTLSGWNEVVSGQGELNGGALQLTETFTEQPLTSQTCWTRAE